MDWRGGDWGERQMKRRGKEEGKKKGRISNISLYTIKHEKRNIYTTK